MRHIRSKLSEEGMHPPSVDSASTPQSHPPRIQPSLLVLSATHPKENQVRLRA